MLFLSSLFPIPLFCALTTYVVEIVSVLCKTCKTAGVCCCCSEIAEELSSLSLVVSMGLDLVVSEFKKKSHKCKTEWVQTVDFLLFIGSGRCVLLEQILHLRMVNQTLESWENLSSGGWSPDSNHGLCKRLWVYLWCCVTTETATDLHFHWEK